MLMNILESTKKHFPDSDAKSQYRQSILFKNEIVSLIKSCGAFTLKKICVNEEDI